MKGRTLLVPDSNGSVEHFYHFLLAYLFPVTAWISARQHPHVAVRSCGPMTPWFDLLQDQATIDVVHPGVMLSAVIGRREPHVVLPQLDNPVLFERRTFADVARTIRGGDHPARVGGPLRIVLTDRGPSDPYYVSEGSERRTSAAERRSLANPDEIERVLQSAGSVTVVDAASMPPADQVALFTATDVLVGQHGAGLANMLWMRPGSTVIEILPPMGPQVLTLFRDLAACLGHRYVAVPQAERHGPVDPESVGVALSTAPAHEAGSMTSRARRASRRVAKGKQIRLSRSATLRWAARLADRR